MRLIDALLRLYPAEFRTRYGDDMRSFHRERLRESGALAWPGIIADHVTSALAEHLRTLVQDAKYGVRTLARRPGWTAIVLATIALGVGANAAIFSVVNGVLLKPLPYPQPERVINMGHQPTTWLTSEPEYYDYKRDMGSLEQLAAYTRNEGNLATTEEPERVALAVVTNNFFAALGVKPMLGRPFAEDEHLSAPASVVIISHALWQRRFASDPTLVGRTLSFNGIPRTVVGIMPAHFDFPTARTDVWLPMRRMNPDSLGDRANHYLFLVGRLKAGVTVEGALAEASTVAKRMMRDFSNRYDPLNPIVPTITLVSDSLVKGTRPYLWTLLGAVGLVLLIMCANVANLLLARGEGRRKEMALRTALGASRTRLMGQLLTECALLALAGGALGLALGWAGQRVLVAVAPDSIPRLEEIRLDARVIGYTIATSAIAGLLFGVVPAMRAAREAPADALKSGSRTSRGRGANRLRRSLVVAEVALAVVMLAGSGMLFRSLRNVLHTDLGFDTRSTLTLKISPVGSTYNENYTASFYAQILERVRALPGVEAAAALRWLPVVDAGGLWGVLPEGVTYAQVKQAPTAVPQHVTTDFVRAMGMKLLSGREFSDEDRRFGTPVAIVSQEMARQLWPQADAVGKRFYLGSDGPLLTVVGVVNDFSSRGFTDKPEPTMYFAFPQSRETGYFMPRSMSLVIRVREGMDPEAVARPVRAIVRSLDATVPVSDVRTLERVVGTSVANRRFSTALIGGFAVLALVLAALGIFGVVSYLVSERTFEIGVRMALGADRGSVLSYVLGDGLRLTLAGIAVGLFGAVIAARAIKSLLYGVPTIDAWTLLPVCLLLALVSVVASLVPARRAVSVSPTDALRAG